MSEHSAEIEQVVREVLDGIDRCETDEPEGGWWEVSAGAAFGAERLRALIERLASARKD